MDFKRMKNLFFKKADEQATRLAESTDPEVSDMTALVTGGVKRDIPVAPHLPDDTETAVSASVAETMVADPENGARMAWASPDLG